MAKVKFCENNFTHGTNDTADKLKEENVDVEVAPCLGYCGVCAMGPFALVDDDMVEADSADELFDKIKSKL